jgi:hypothetical protein
LLLFKTQLKYLLIKNEHTFDVTGFEYSNVSAIIPTCELYLEPNDFLSVGRTLVAIAPDACKGTSAMNRYIYALGFRTEKAMMISSLYIIILHKR